jgi:hypothetical protein
MAERDAPLVQVTGGQLNVQAMAVGSRARAVVNGSAQTLQQAGRDDVLKKLQDVLDALDRHGTALPDRATADALVSRITSEVAKEQPDKFSLKAFLAGLSDEVKSISQIATTVIALGGTILALFP